MKHISFDINNCGECPYYEIHQSNFPRGELGRTYYCTKTNKVLASAKYYIEHGENFAPDCPLPETGT